MTMFSATRRLGFIRPTLSQSSLDVMCGVITVGIVAVNLILVSSNLIRTYRFNHTAFHHVSQLVDVFYRSPTKWARVLTLWNPAHDAISVEIVTLVTFELWNLVFSLIVTEADLTLGFCSEFIGIERSSWQVLNNLRHFIVRQTVGAPHLLFLKMSNNEIARNNAANHTAEK